MSYAIVKWNAANLHFFGDLRLMPGANEATKAQVEELKNHFISKHQIETGMLEIIIKEKDEQGLGGFKNAEAVKLIANTMDKQLLTFWLQSEKRPQVAKAIQDQISKLAIEPIAAKKDVVESEEEEHFK